MSALTVGKLEYAVRKIAAERSAFVYSDPSGVRAAPRGAADCRYVHRAGDGSLEAGCIIGQAFDLLGIPLSEEWTGYIDEVLFESFGFENASFDGLWLKLVQQNQDDGMPWGEAVHDADRRVGVRA